MRIFTTVTAIYKFLGLDKSECFPDPVQQTVTKPMDAKYYPYSVEGKGIRQCESQLHNQISLNSLL